MKTGSILFGLMLFSLPCAIAAPAPVQTKHAVPSRQQTADTDSRKQLAAYLADFQGKPEDTVLRDEIIALAKTLNPAPAIPQPARDSFAKATAQKYAASSADDFKAAAKLFELAAVQAPWYAKAYYGAASAYAQSADYDRAKRNLALYRAAARPGDDTRIAEDLEREMDHQQVAQQLQQVLRQFVADPSSSARIEIIKLVQAMKTPPEIPEEARGHFVMAVVLTNSEDAYPGSEQRAIEEFQAALLAAPWWGDAYKKLATVQASVGRYNDAVASLSYYQLTLSADARKSEDAQKTEYEIYRLKALGQREADAKAKKQEEELHSKLLSEKQQEELAVIEAMKYTVEGKWYQDTTPNDFFLGGKSNPECDYSVKQNGGRWTITNSCSRSKWGIDSIEVRGRELTFRLAGHDPAYPFSQVVVTFALSEDGKTLEGRGNPYDNALVPIGDHPVRWVRRE
jgi:hypothetical protein